MRDPSEAETHRIADLKRKLQKDPASRIFFDLAREYHEAGRFQEAAEICAKGLRQHPPYLSARVLLGRIYFDMGRSDDAREQMETALQQAPDNLVARRVLAQICLEQGDLAGALERYRALLAFSPTDAEAAARIDQLERRLATGGPPLEADATAARAAPLEPPLEPVASSPADVIHQAEVADQPEPARPPVLEAAGPAPAVAAPPAEEPVPVLVEEAMEVQEEIFVEVVSEELVVSELNLEPGVLATPTLAEIYMDQGLTDKAALVYREILKGDPENTEARARLAEIERGQRPAADDRAESARRRIRALNTWLEAIRGASRV